jgi:hypothetical protein
MEEKRKLEKLLLSDIDSALASYNSGREKERESLQTVALAKPPAQAEALLASYVRAKKAMTEASHALEAIGFDVKSDYSNNYGFGLKLHYSTSTKSLREFDSESKKTRSALAELKRTYTLKLFAGGEAAQELFASLSGELATIITR